VPLNGSLRGTLPESVITSLPQIVTPLAPDGPPCKILIKKDRFFFVLVQSSLGIPVV
jgi:hypothetical protein